ncbi:hypothetical protein SDC9_195896 [bioreactor metagenome]|uniref:Uncharacterized protein n=1 Tax=bioreactor metagenome TaxID=1076179 RepID=A0A645ICV6_9ZZZZ
MASTSTTFRPFSLRTVPPPAVATGISGCHSMQSIRFWCASGQSRHKSRCFRPCRLRSTLPSPVRATALSMKLLTFNGENCWPPWYWDTAWNLIKPCSMPLWMVSGPSAKRRPGACRPTTAISAMPSSCLSLMQIDP